MLIRSCTAIMHDESMMIEFGARTRGGWELFETRGMWVVVKTWHGGLVVALWGVWTCARSCVCQRENMRAEPSH